MPINPNGTITAPAERYSTRVLVEYKYPATSLETAQGLHDAIRRSLLAGVYQLDTVLQASGVDGTVLVTDAENPQPVLLEPQSPPEGGAGIGEGAETGGSVGSGAG